MFDLLGRQLGRGDFIIYFVRGSLYILPRIAIIEDVNIDELFVYSGRETANPTEIKVSRRIKLTSPTLLKISQSELDEKLIKALQSKIAQPVLVQW